MPEKLNPLNNNKEKQETKEFQNQLNNFQKELLSNLDINNEKLNTTREKLRNLLKENSKPGPLNIDFYLEVAKIEEELYSPELKNNENAKLLRDVINIINLDTSGTKEEIINQISKVFDNPNISLSTKYQLANFLSQHYLGELVQKTKSGYISDPEKSVKVINKLIKKYPKYNWDNSVLISDPEGGYVYTNNF